MYANNRNQTVKQFVFLAVDMTIKISIVLLLSLIIVGTRFLRIITFKFFNDLPRKKSKISQIFTTSTFVQNIIQ